MKPLPSIKSCQIRPLLWDFFLTMLLISVFCDNLACFEPLFSPSVTSTSMGETFLSQDIASAFYNPALLFLLDKSQVSASHWFLFDGARHNFFGYGERFETFVVAFSGSQVYRDEIEIRKTLTDEPSYTYSSKIIGLLSFATRGPLDIFCGASLKVAYYDIYNYRSTGYGLDTGIYKKIFTFGSLLRNQISISISNSFLNLLGPTIKLVSDKETFPVTLRTGIVIDVTLFPKYDIKKESLVYDKLDFVLEAITSRKTFLHYGLQYRLLNMLYFRSGYTPSGISAGLGIGFRDLQFNYCFVPREYTTLHAVDITYKFGEIHTFEKPPDELNDYLKTVKRAERIYEKFLKDTKALCEDKKYDLAKELLNKITPIFPDRNEAKDLLRFCENAIKAEKISMLNTKYQQSLQMNDFTGASDLVIEAVDTVPNELSTKNMIANFRSISLSEDVLERVNQRQQEFITTIMEKIDKAISVRNYEQAEYELTKLQMLEPESENTYLQKNKIAENKTKYINELLIKALQLQKEQNFTEAYLLLKEAYRVSKDETVRFQMNCVGKKYTELHKPSLTEELYQKKLYYLAAIAFANDEHAESRKTFYELKTRNVVFNYTELEEALIKNNIIQRR